MRRRNVGFAAVAVTAIAIAGYLAGARINDSASMPVGLYWKVNRKIRHGSIVAYCPPKTAQSYLAFQRHYVGRGTCPSDSQPLLKQVVAVSGDVVSVTGEGITVNGIPVSGTAPLAYDGEGYPLPTAELRDHPLEHSELMLVGTNSELSFDSRYFGLVDRSEIIAVLTPVLTW